MKIWLKRILIGLVVAFLVALVGIAIFLLTFDPNAYKNKLQEIVYARYERTLLIDGDIELSLFPRIGLSVQDVSLSDRGNSDLFASIDSARLAVAIWPLMFNRLVVDHVAITGLKAWMVRSPDGRYNFDDLVSRRQAAGLPAPDLASPLTALAGTVGIAQAAAGGVTAVAVGKANQGSEAITGPEGGQASAESVPGPAVAAEGVSVAAAPPSADRPALSGRSSEGTDLHIDIAGLTLRDGQIHLHDKKNNYVGHIVNLELNTGRMTADQPSDVAFRGRLLGDFPAADARFDGQALVRFNADQKTYSAQRVNVQVSGLLGDLNAHAAALRGNLAYSAYSKMFSAGGLDFSVQGDIQGANPVRNLEASLVVPQLKLDRSQAELQVERLSLRAKGEQGKDSFQLGIDAPNLSVSPDSARGEPLTATVQRQGDGERVALVLGMSGLGGNARQLTLKELKLDGQIQQGDQHVQINMTSPASWHVFEERGNLSAMRGDVRIEHPALPGGTFEFPFIGSMAADLPKSDIRSELDAVLSGSKLSFRVGVTQLERPQIDFDLQADQLDFNTLFPAAAHVVQPGSPAAAESKQAPEQQAEEPAQQAAAAPPEPERVRTWNLAPLRNVDLRGKVEVGRLQVQRLEAEQVRFDVRAADGKMEVKNIQAELYEGKLNGQLSATADNQMALDLSAAGVALEPFMEAATGQRRLAGTASLRAKLQSEGMTLPAVIAALDGSAQLGVRDGAIRGIDAAQTLRQVQTLIRSVTTGDAGDKPVVFNPGTETAFSQLDLDLGFSNGQGTVRKLSLVSPAVRASQGKPAAIDLVNRQLNVVVNMRVAGSANATRDLTGLRGVTVPVLVRGDLDDPSYQVQWKDIGGAAVREVVKGGLLELLGNQLEPALPDAPVEDASPAAPAGDTPPPPKDTLRSIGDALKGLLGQ